MEAAKKLSESKFKPESEKDQEKLAQLQAQLQEKISEAAAPVKDVADQQTKLKEEPDSPPKDTIVEEKQISFESKSDNIQTQQGPDMEPTKQEKEADDFRETKLKPQPKEEKEVKAQGRLEGAYPSTPVWGQFPVHGHLIGGGLGPGAGLGSYNSVGSSITISAGATITTSAAIPVVAPLQQHQMHQQVTPQHQHQWPHPMGPGGYVMPRMYSAGTNIVPERAYGLSCPPSYVSAPPTASRPFQIPDSNPGSPVGTSHRATVGSACPSVLRTGSPKPSAWSNSLNQLALRRMGVGTSPPSVESCSPTHQQVSIPQQVPTPNSSYRYVVPARVQRVSPVHSEAVPGPPSASIGPGRASPPRPSAPPPPPISAVTGSAPYAYQGLSRCASACGTITPSGGGYFAAAIQVPYNRTLATSQSQHQLNTYRTTPPPTPVLSGSLAQLPEASTSGPSRPPPTPVLSGAGVVKENSGIGASSTTSSTGAGTSAVNTAVGAQPDPPTASAYPKEELRGTETALPIVDSLGEPPSEALLGSLRGNPIAPTSPVHKHWTTASASASSGSGPTRSIDASARGTPLTRGPSPESRRKSAAKKEENSKAHAHGGSLGWNSQTNSGLEILHGKKLCASAKVYLYQAPFSPSVRYVDGAETFLLPAGWAVLRSRLGLLVWLELLEDASFEALLSDFASSSPPKPKQGGLSRPGSPISSRRSLQFNLRLPPAGPKALASQVEVKCSRVGPLDQACRIPAEDALVLRLSGGTALGFRATLPSTVDETFKVWLSDWETSI